MKFTFITTYPHDSIINPSVSAPNLIVSFKIFLYVFIYWYCEGCMCHSVWAVRAQRVGGQGTKCGRSGRSVWESLPPFHYVDPKNGTVVSRLGSKHLYPLTNCSLQVPFLCSVALRTVCNMQTLGGTLITQCSIRGLLMSLPTFPTLRRRPPSVSRRFFQHFTSFLYKA